VVASNSAFTQQDVFSLPQVPHTYRCYS